MNVSAEEPGISKQKSLPETAVSTEGTSPAADSLPTLLQSFPVPIDLLPLNPKIEISKDGLPILSDAFEIFPEEWKAKVYIGAPFYTFYLGTPRIDGVAFLPNFNPEVGISLGYKKWSFEMSQPFRVLPDYESSRRGDSNKQEYIFSGSMHRLAYDFYSQYYRGFYISSALTGLAGGQPARYAQLPDTQVHNAGINLYFVFHPLEYSMAAAFTFTEFQFKSGGSPIAHLYLNRLDMSPGVQFIPGTAPGADVKPDIFAGTFWSAGAAAGYGYTYSYKRLFVTAQGIFGFGPQYQELNDKAGSYSRSNVQIKINGALAVGITRRYDYMGVQAKVDSIYGEIQNGQLASSLVTTNVYYGQRF